MHCVRGGRQGVLSLAFLCCLLGAAPLRASAESQPVSGQTPFFRGSAGIRALEDHELAAFRGAAAAPACADRTPRRRVVLWDEARHAEVTLPANSGDNSISARGAVQPGGLLR